jgi:hypothetical protein
MLAKKLSILAVAGLMSAFVAVDANAQGWRGGGGGGWGGWGGWGGGGGCHSFFLSRCEPAAEAPIPAVGAALGVGVSGLVAAGYRRARRKKK